MVVQVHPKDHQLNCPTSGLTEPIGIELSSVDTSRPRSDNLPVTTNEDQSYQDQTYHRDLNDQDWPLKYTTVDTTDQQPLTEFKSETDHRKTKPKVDGRKLALEGRFPLDKHNQLTMIDRHNIHRVFGLKIWFVTDVCGIICASFTYWLLLFAQYVVLTCILLPEESLLYKGMYPQF